MRDARQGRGCARREREREYGVPRKGHSPLGVRAHAFLLYSVHILIQYIHVTTALGRRYHGVLSLKWGRKRETRSESSPKNILYLHTQACHIFRPRTNIPVIYPLGLVISHPLYIYQLSTVSPNLSSAFSIYKEGIRASFVVSCYICRSWERFPSYIYIHTYTNLLLLEVGTFTYLAISSPLKCRK